MELLDFWDWFDTHSEPMGVSVTSILLLIVFIIVGVIWASNSRAKSWKAEAENWKKEVEELRGFTDELDKMNSYKNSLEEYREMCDELERENRELKMKNELLADTNDKLTSILKAQGNGEQCE